MEELQRVYSRYEGQQSDLIPILQDVQDTLGYIPPEAIKATAEFLRIAESTVYGVVTFYTQFYLTRQGRHKIKVCQGTACHVAGADDVMRAVEDKLGIKAGESTDDFEFNLERVACFGSCALAPVVVVDGKVYGNVTPEQTIKILEGLE
jgi:NADH-quinone oxidoreductase subunit E